MILLLVMYMVRWSARHTDAAGGAFSPNAAFDSRSVDGCRRVRNRRGTFPDWSRSSASGSLRV